MLGILLIYFIGNHFYKLAAEYNKNKWLFAIIGVVSYYAGSFIGGVILAILNELFMLRINWDNNLILGILALPFGLGVVYLVSFLLKRNWKKTIVEVKDEIKDIGKSIESLEENN